MKYTIIPLIVLMFLAPAATAMAQGVSIGISSSDGRKNFFLAIGDYYKVPESRVVYVRDHYRIPDEELPVVFFLASRARVDPQVIINLRLRQRMSWLAITLHYGLSPEIYYVPVNRVGSSYGNTYGRYQRNRGDYRKMTLSDAEVVNLVNLRFLSEHQGVAAETIMDRRGRGEKFITINEDFYKGKNRSKSSGKSQGNRRNNGHGQGD